MQPNPPRSPKPKCPICQSAITLMYYANTRAIICIVYKAILMQFINGDLTNTYATIL